MRILGVDPGIRNVGWAIVSANDNDIIEYGVADGPELFLTSTWYGRAGEDCGASLKTQRFVDALFGMDRTDVITMEGVMPYHVSNNNFAKLAAQNRDMAKVCILIGMIQHFAFSRGVGLSIFARSSICAFLVGGTKSADKKAMQKAVQERLGLDAPIKPDHANDAVCVALLAARYETMQKAVRKTAPYQPIYYSPPSIKGR